ncbi:MAG: 6-bladed beta-propeller [Bacteroidota bacterium]
MQKTIVAFILASLFITDACIGQPEFTLVKEWGGFGDKPGQLKFPALIAVDQKENVYVVDQHNHRVQKFDSNGNFITMWGKSGTGPGEFNYPYGIAIDSKGDVFVSDMNNNRIQKFSSRGDFIATVGMYGSEDGQFKYPYGIAFDQDNVLYVIDAFNYRVQKFTNALQFLGKWGSAESIGIKLYMPHEIAVTKDGKVIMTDRQNHRVTVFSKDGQIIKRFGEYAEGALANGGAFSEPHGIAVNEAGEILISDRYNFRIELFDASFNYKAKWNTPGISDDSKHFPLGIATGKNQIIYVTDHYAHTIQQFRVNNRNK